MERIRVMGMSARGSSRWLRRCGRTIAIGALGVSVVAPLSPAQDGREPRPRDSVDAVHAGGVMIVFLREIVFDTNTSGVSDEPHVVRCITEGIRRRQPHLPIVSFEAFSAVAFPNLAAKARPRRPDYLGILLGDAEFRRRIAPLGLRHIVFVGGITETKPPRGGIACGADSRGAGGCLGVVIWDKRSALAASIVDLASRAPARELKAEARGTAWLAIIGIIPLGMPAMTETAACTEIGHRVADALAQGGN